MNSFKCFDRATLQYTVECYHKRVSLAVYLRAVETADFGNVSAYSFDSGTSTNETIKEEHQSDLREFKDMMELENARGDFLYFRMDYIYSHAERITPENVGVEDAFDWDDDGFESDTCCG